MGPPAGGGVDGGHREGVEHRVLGAHRQMALKWSNGSRHARQTHSDLHAVDPKRLSSWVSGEPQWVHRTLRVSGTTPSRGRVAGGAMPYASSLRLPSSLIQSVVHAGASTNSTSTSIL